MIYKFIILISLYFLLVGCKTKHSKLEENIINASYTIIQCGNNPFETGETPDITLSNFIRYTKEICDNAHISGLKIERFAENVCLACHCPTGDRIHFKANQTLIDCFRQNGLNLD